MPKANDAMREIMAGRSTARHGRSRARCSLLGCASARCVVSHELARDLIARHQAWSSSMAVRGGLIASSVERVAVTLTRPTSAARGTTCRAGGAVRGVSETAPRMSPSSSWHAGRLHPMLGIRLRAAKSGPELGAAP